MSKAAHVNSVMRSINEYTDNIYESLIDSDFDSLNQNIVQLTALLKDLQQTIKEEL